MANRNPTDSSLTKAFSNLEGKRRTVAQREPAMEQEQLTLLPQWADDFRAFPNALARGALFSAAKGSGTDFKRTYFENELIHSLAGIRLEYRGQELMQDDCSVLLAILQFSKGIELGKQIHFTAYRMLKELGWSINSAEYEHLKECCSRLSATNITLTVEKGAGYAGSLLRSFQWKDDEGTQMSQWSVLLEPKIARLFEDNEYTLLAHDERKQIGGRAPLALWLHSFLSTHREPLPISVTRYHKLCRSRSDNINDFRRRLKVALEKLKSINFLAKWEIQKDIVYVTRVPRKRVSNFQEPELLQ